MTVLVTGGLGYIGSHACVALAAAGYEVEILDNLSNSKRSVLSRLKEISGRDFPFHEIDLRRRERVEALFKSRAFASVVHFAGLKAVGESVEKPELYRENNVGGTENLLEAMALRGVSQIVFSSSATVYGEPGHLPIAESDPIRPQSPYGENKAEIERLLAARAAADPTLRYAALRYFNPIGAHPSGRIGEDPRGVPNNLLPFVAQVAVGRQPRLRIFGDDYPTADGTGVRDYIHVMDLASGHVAALRFLENKSITANLGTGRGYSVLEVVRAFERASGRTVPLEVHPRRAGDVASCYADASLAAAKLGWKARAGIDEMCRDSWRWQSANPEGYP